MGLSRTSTGAEVLKRQDKAGGYCSVALTGSPNVGKSTVFNLLTGLKQHTGNWPGKTVTNARGYCRGEKHEYELVDTPGTYSLNACSEEERIARDFVCFGDADAVIIVCDGVCLEKNLLLALQIGELGKKTLICINLMDEVRRKGIELRPEGISEMLGMPIAAISAKDPKSREIILKALDELLDSASAPAGLKIKYPDEIESALDGLSLLCENTAGGKINARWLSLKLLSGDREILERADTYLEGALKKNTGLMHETEAQKKKLLEQGIDEQKLRDMIISSAAETAAQIARKNSDFTQGAYSRRDRGLDKLLTGKLLGYPLMLLLLLGVFYITISGANYPSELLSSGLFYLEQRLRRLLNWMNLPPLALSFLLDGIYRVLAWVVSVMLPPMAIFFPLFTLLEDAGYLPRAAYNLDRPFHRCGACGKQALTMCMGFGCNAAGVTGCRIIGSEREKLLAVLTNSFVPCNGRFPMLITIMTLFFTGSAIAGISNLLSAAMLTALIVLGVAASFLFTRLLSKTVLKGSPSAFVLELPPYRRPKAGQVIVRSIFDRTLFVLGRAVLVAAPAGAILWLMVHVHVYGESLLSISAGFLEPLGRLMGMDGVILVAFILGFPANEIVLPIIIMAYTAAGNLTEPGSLSEIGLILSQNGWTAATALCTMLFTLFHWPCSTTLLTVKKETGSKKWTALAALLPTAAGVICCCAVSAAIKLFTA